jgi:hypothetical protein
MSLPPSDYFDASFAGATQVVQIASFHEAKIFARRWVIRDKEPALKALLRRMEQANSSATADSAIRELKQALACRGMLVTTSPLYSIERPLHLSVERITYFTEPVLPWAAPPNDQGTAAEDRSVATQRVGHCSGDFGQASERIF